MTTQSVKSAPKTSTPKTSTPKSKAKSVKNPPVTPEYVAQIIFLHRCKYFQNKGQGVDPRTIKGAVALFGSKKALDAACTAEGM
jgi:hypothetical protein